MTAETEQVVALDSLGEELAGLRVISDDALRRMRQSLARHGQLTALATYQAQDGGLGVVDGFKRLRAARELRLPTLRVRTVAHTLVRAKIALSLLNEAHGLSELEEAWLCRTLYRDDKLSQPEIGQLLGKHKSWVCRRLVLVEALDDVVQADVRLGLLGARTACALRRLHRCNQPAAADVVMRRGLTSAQTERLVADALAAPDVARFLADALATPTLMATSRPTVRERTPAEWIVADAGAVHRLAARLHARLLGPPLAALGAPAPLVADALRSLVPALAALHDRIRALTKESHADLDHPRGARSPGRDPVPAGPDPPCDRSSARGQPQHGPEDPRGACPGT